MKHTRRVTLTFTAEQWDWLQDEVTRRFGEDYRHTVKDAIMSIIREEMMPPSRWEREDAE